MAGLGPVDDPSVDSRVSSLPVLEISHEKRSKRNPKQLDFESVSILIYLYEMYQVTILHLPSNL